MRTVGYIVTGMALIGGIGMNVWLLGAFLAAVVEPWQVPLTVLRYVAGIAVFVYVLGTVSKNFNRVAAGTRWLVLGGFGLLVALSPLLLLAARSSWGEDFRSPQCITCQGPAMWLPLSDYAVPAVIFGTALVVLGLGGWLALKLRTAAANRRDS